MATKTTGNTTGTPNNSTRSNASMISPALRVMALGALTLPLGIMVAGCSSGASHEGTDFGAGACGISGAQDNQASYKDGTYHEAGSYISHEGEQHFTVDVTLKNGLVSDVKATPGTTQKTSLGYQTSFAKHLPETVKGCPIESVKIHAIGGASLTSGEFNKLMTKLRAQAKK